MIMDPEAHRVGEKANYVVSMTAILANIPGALFWATNKILDSKMSIFNLVFSQILILDLFLIAMAI